MTTLEGRGSRALLVVDLQVGVVDGAYQREEVIATVADLVAQARASSVPVVWVQHHDDELVRGSEAWQWVYGLGPADGEPVVEKSYGDAFAETNLEQVLAEHGVSDLVLVGAASEQCIRCTMHSAVVGGYDVSLVADAHTTTDLTAYGLPAPAVVVGFLNAMPSSECSGQGGARGRSSLPKWASEFGPRLWGREGHRRPRECRRGTGRC